MKIKRTVFAVVLGIALGTAGVAGAATSVHWPATCTKFSCVDKHLTVLHHGVKRALHRAMTPGPAGVAGTNGTDGTNGIDGTNGTNGTNGIDGTNGTNGTDGQSVTVTAEAAGANCANAGQKLVSVSGTSYVCNGAGGVTTVTIVAGTAGAFAGNAAVGTAVTSTATCASGKLVGGGANITGNDPAHTLAAVTSSYPSAAATWTATATAFLHAANGSPPSITAYALCAS
jgi:hypothetical protein